MRIDPVEVVRGLLEAISANKLATLILIGAALAFHATGVEIGPLIDAVSGVTIQETTP